MAQVDASRLHALSALDPVGAGIATHSFEVDHGVATLLDAGRIAALPGVPMVDEPAPAQREDASARREPILLFGWSGRNFGIAARHVDATVPVSVLRESPLVGELCRGVIEHHGFEVPVLDTLALLGLGRIGTVEQASVIVLRLPGGHLGLMIDEVRDIVHAAPGDLLPMQAIGLARADMFRGMLVPEGGMQHLVVDGVRIERDPLLASLAGLSAVKHKNAHKDRPATTMGTARDRRGRRAAHVAAPGPAAVGACAEGRGAPSCTGAGGAGRGRAARILSRDRPLQRCSTGAASTSLETAFKTALTWRIRTTGCPGSAPRPDAFPPPETS